MVIAIDRLHEARAKQKEVKFFKSKKWVKDTMGNQFKTLLQRENELLERKKLICDCGSLSIINTGKHLNGRLFVRCGNCNRVWIPKGE